MNDVLAEEPCNWSVWLSATLQARAKTNNIQPPHLNANDFTAAAAVNYELESVNNTHPDARKKRAQNKRGDIPGYVGRCPKGTATTIGGFRSSNQCCRLYQPTQEEWKSQVLHCIVLYCRPL